jgi:ATP synthase protein I
MQDTPKRDDKAATDSGGTARGGAVSVGAFAGLGVQFAASILIFLYAGRWLDGKLGTAPYLLMAGAFVGAGLGFYAMYRRLTAADRAADQERRRS